MANFTSYSNALVLMIALCNKLQELNEAYVFKGSVTFENLPATLTKDMCGYTYNVANDFTTDNRFVEGAGKSYSAGSNVVVANMTTTTYDEVTPAGTENPSEEGWYELVDSDYVLTQDTEIQTDKTYYEQVVTPSYKFDVIGNFVDVESIIDSISSVAGMITDNTFNPASAYSIGDIVIYENSLYQFKAAHTADTAWDATEVDEITVEGQLADKADKTSTLTSWKGTAAQYAQLQTDDYDLYFIEEAVSP